MATNRDFASPSKNSRNKIRRPINAFLLYGNEIRPQLKRDNPGVKHLDISKMLGKMWRESSQEIKNEYMERARIIRENHKTQNPEYRYCPKDMRLKKKARKEARNRKSKNKSEISSKRIKKRSGRSSRTNGDQRNGNQLMIEINESEESDDSTYGPMNGFPVNVNAMPIDMSDESDIDSADDNEEDEEN